MYGPLLALPLTALQWPTAEQEYFVQKQHFGKMGRGNGLDGMLVNLSWKGGGDPLMPDRLSECSVE